MKIALWISVFGFLFAAPPQATAQTVGYAKAITQRDVQARSQTLLEKAVNGIGLPASFQSCRLYEQVAVGARDGATAYGAVCRIALGGRSPREFVVCTNDLNGGFDLYDGAFVNSAGWMEEFIRKNCF